MKGVEMSRHTPTAEQSDAWAAVAAIVLVRNHDDSSGSAWTFRAVSDLDRPELLEALDVAARHLLDNCCPRLPAAEAPEATVTWLRR